MTHKFKRTNNFGNQLKRKSKNKEYKKSIEEKSLQLTTIYGDHQALDRVTLYILN